MSDKFDNHRELSLIENIVKYNKISLWQVRKYPKRSRKKEKLFRKIMKKIDIIVSFESDKINERDPNGKTPLILLHQTNNGMSDFEIIEKLIESGAEINVRDACGNTALYYAIIRHPYADTIEELEKIKILLENGADPNLQYDKNETILHILLNYNRGIAQKIKYSKINLYQIIELLINYGANPNLYNIKQKTPIHLLKKLYKDFEVNYDMFIKILELLIEKVEDLKILDENLILHELCDGIVYNVCKFTRSLASNPDNFFDNTIRIMESLLKRGIDVNKKNGFGNIPLLHFLKGISMERKWLDKKIGSRQKVKQIIYLLLEYNSDLNIKNFYDVSINDLLDEWITSEFYKYQMKKMEEKYVEKIKKLEKKIEILEYVPGNPKYYEAMGDFNRLLEYKKN